MTAPINPLTLITELDEAVRLKALVATLVTASSDGIDYWQLRDAVAQQQAGVGPDTVALMGAIELTIKSGDTEWGHPQRWIGDWNWNANPEAWTVKAVLPGTTLTYVAEDIRPTPARSPWESRHAVVAIEQDALPYRVVGEDQAGQVWILGYANSGRVNTICQAASYLGNSWSEPEFDDDGMATGVDQVEIGSVDVERRMGNGSWLITDRLIQTAGGGINYTDVMSKRTQLPPPTVANPGAIDL